ncbi:type II toxin-antitoxin system HipA family toxin, partial [Myxococcota bacterium]|nr:type II toxin-antitoxin system HipA family toxin [Myxococcota bacterium]
MIAILEIFVQNQWHRLAEFTPLSKREIPKGFRSKTHFSYDDLWAIKHIEAYDYRAVSCRYPVDFDLYTSPSWPAFMLDILPLGAARRALSENLGIKDNDGADWTLLLEGAHHPPGNLRIWQEDSLTDDESQRGFTKEQVAERDPAFVEYAFQHRIGVAGTSGAHGESPKFLLTEDASGILFADGVLPDTRARQHWLVKWPKDHRQSDRAVLRNEAAYRDLAKYFGVRVEGKSDYFSDTLFLPRFDRRVVGGRVERFGLESFTSLAGVSDFGVRFSQDRLLEVVAEYSTSPLLDIVEFVLRDILNVAFGNTDNHGRNSAMLKTPDGKIRLSPLYDFAPMILDEDGIPRACRWKDA